MLRGCRKPPAAGYRHERRQDSKVLFGVGIAKGAHEERPLPCALEAQNKKEIIGGF